MRRRWILMLCLAGVYGSALADTPLLPPETQTRCSRSGTFCATSDVHSGITTIHARSSDTALWQIPGWHRQVHVSDDGDSAVVVYEGLNLVPVDVSLQQPVLFFHHRGKQVRRLLLGDLYQGTSELVRTASHLAWCSSIGFNDAQQFVVERVVPEFPFKGDRVAFSAVTGVEEPLIGTPDR